MTNMIELIQEYAYSVNWSVTSLYNVGQLAYILQEDIQLAEALLEWKAKMERCIEMEFKEEESIA